MLSPSTFFSIVLAFLATAGLVCLVMAVYFRRHVGSSVSDVWLKVLVKGILILAGCVGVFSAYTKENRENWFLAALLGALCAFFWEALQLFVDGRIRAAERINREAFDRALNEGRARTRLISFVHRFMTSKIKRVARELRNPSKSPSLGVIRRALTPEPHLEEILEGLALYFLESLPDGLRDRANFRAGVYVESKGTMEPAHAISLNNTEYSPFNSYQQNPDMFRLSAQGPRSQIVKCVEEHRTLIVSDCEESARLKEFDFSSDGQRSYLRSMIAYNLGRVGAEQGNPTRAVLAVDTDQPGFFCEDNRIVHEFALREFGVRLRLELLLIALVSRRGETE